MTRKDYITLAQALRASKPQDMSQGFVDVQLQAAGKKLHQTAMVQWLTTVDAIANALQADNPRFERARFNTAAGA